MRKQRSLSLAVDTVIIDRLKTEEIPAAAYIISRAIVGTRNSIALWGGQGEEKRARVEKAIRIANLEHPRGLTLAARLNGQLVGAVYMVEWPDCQLSFRESLRLIPKLWSTTRGIMRQSVRLQSISAKIDPPEPHWHLGPIGILPELQSQGIGRELMNGMCQVLDESQLPGYLETDQAAIKAHLLRLGFQVVQEANILDVHNWCMLRPPSHIAPLGSD